MKYLETIYHEVINSEVINNLLTQAKEQYGNITYCGFESNWNDCITGYLNREGNLKVLLYFNVGTDTKTVETVLNIN
jgi:hypothetical protein